MIYSAAACPAQRHIGFHGLAAQALGLQRGAVADAVGGEDDGVVQGLRRPLCRAGGETDLSGAGGNELLLEIENYPVLFLHLAGVAATFASKDRIVARSARLDAPTRWDSIWI